MPNLVDRWPLVGRDHELRRLSALSREPAGRGVVLVGPAGVGRSRLSRECLDAAEARGMRGAIALATRSASNIPLGALAPVLTDLSDATPNLSRARAALSELAGGEPLLLVVDDANLLDDLSATVVLNLAEDPHIVPFVTVRAGEPQPDAITALWKEAGAERVDLSPLADVHVRALLELVLGGPVSEATLERLVGLSGGKPLVLRELVDAGVVEGALRVVDGQWRLANTLAVPARLAELVSARLDGIGGRVNDLVAALALTEPLPLAVVDRLGLHPELTELDDRRLVRMADASNGGGRRSPVTGTEPATVVSVRLDQQIYGEVALDRTGELRRRALLSECARALEEVSTADHDRFRVVLWRCLAGEDVDPQTLVAAARRSYEVGDYRHCGEMAAAAWKVEPSFDAGHLLGFSLGRAGQVDEAETILSLTQELAATDRELVLVTLARSENLLRGLGDLSGADRLCREAEAAVTSPEWRAEITAHRAMGVVQSGAILDAVELLEPLLADADTAPRAFVKAAYAGGIALSHLGHTDRATAVAVAALPRHEALWSEDLFQTEPGVHHLSTLFALVASGRMNDAATLLELAREVTRPVVPRYAHAWILFLSGMADVAAGRPSDAVEHLTRAVPIFLTGTQREVARWCNALAATAEALRGDTAAASRRLADADALAVPGMHLNRSLVEQARGWVAAAKGDRNAAREIFSTAAAEVLSRGDRFGAARLLHDQARVGGAPQVVETLDSIAADVDGAAVGLMARQARGLAGELDGAELAALSEELEAHGFVLWSAETAAEASRAHRRAGDARAAAPLATRAVELLDRCQGARTHLTAVADAPDPLTPRERDIALLAAERLTSKEIAERLHLSSRTVDNNLRRIYQKLGVASRSELANVLS